MKEMILNVI